MLSLKLWFKGFYECILLKSNVNGVQRSVKSWTSKKEKKKADQAFHISNSHFPYQRERCCTAWKKKSPVLLKAAISTGQCCFSKKKKILAALKIVEKKRTAVLRTQTSQWLPCRQLLLKPSCGGLDSLMNWFYKIGAHEKPGLAPEVF